MKFTKMQGIGNDYVYVNCFEETVEDPCETAKMVSDRHFGIGSDGLILIKPSDVADCQMDMYNLDGSRGAMCGNGIRCVGKYAYDHGIVDKPEIDVETPSGIKHLSMKVKDGKVELVTVDMGRPVPTSEIGEPITVDGKEYRFTGVSMGNPHAVVFMDGIKDLEIEKIGPSFESHEIPGPHQYRICGGCGPRTCQYACLGARLRRDSGMRNRCMCDCGRVHLKWSYR